MIGRRLAQYEILEKIGAGGMGEVYRAHDTRLDRDVAIKMLPESFVGDSDRLARFEREARLLASLNHTNIAAIYGLEEVNSIRFLVLELVDGEDLSERIARGPVPVNEVMVIARQIAEAIEDAHGHGVIHRDLKPANIKITPDGKVKVLDFGLAKALDPDSGESPELSQSPTLLSDATQHGVILGTAAYMSPEQARGKAVDHRTDIWAFGCVLYEMLTGQACYTGDTITDILTGILHREPELDELPDVPSGLRRVVERCLRKDRAQRIQHIGDARIEIDDALAGGTDAALPATATRSRGRWWGAVVGGVLGVLLGVTAMIVFGSRGTQDTASHPVRFYVTPPSNVTTVQNPTLSPNARWLAYATNDGVLIHDLERNEPRVLPSLRDANEFVFFSPDSDWIGFHAGGKLQKVRVTGGVAVEVVDVGAHPGAAWGSRKTIVYPETWASGLFEISEDGGQPRQVTTLQRDQGETGHWSPHFLPDGRHVLFTVFTTRGSLKHCRMDILDLDTGERTDLGAGAYPVYLSSGHIVYHRSGVYEMASFDLAKKEFTGPPSIVMDQVPWVSPSGTRGRFFSVSDNGVLAHITVDDYPEGGARSFYRLDRSGAIDPTPLPARIYKEFEVSPDGKRLVCNEYGGGEWDIWVYDLDRGTGRRLTRESNNIRPHWHPDSRRIAFTSIRLGTFDAFGLDVDSSDSPTPLFTAEQDAFPMCWTPEGTLIAGLTTTDKSDNIVRVEGGKPIDLIATDALEGSASVSPDGVWIAYMSNRSGREEVYVQPMDRTGNTVQISSVGGDIPLWSRNTNELFFREGPTVGEIMVVSYEVRDGRFVASRPVPYLQVGADEVPVPGQRVSPTDVYGAYSVSPNGGLIVTLFETNPVPRVHVALDGFGELERQAVAER